jgi:hypothetical protein
VSLVVDLATRCEQITEPPVTDQVGSFITGPGQERLVDPDDGAVRKRRQVTARCMLVEVLGIVVPGQS